MKEWHAGQKEGGGKTGMPSKFVDYYSNLNIVEMDTSYSIYSLNESQEG
jgi:hypothetical protein